MQKSSSLQDELVVTIYHHHIASGQGKFVNSTHPTLKFCVPGLLNSKYNLFTVQTCKALNDITEVLGEAFTVNDHTIKTNEITLHIMEDEEKHLSAISYTIREHNVTDTTSHLNNMRTGVSMTDRGWGNVMLGRV